MSIFLNNLEQIVKQMGNFTKYGKDYRMGYITALKDERLISEIEWKIMADIVLWKRGKNNV